MTWGFGRCFVLVHSEVYQSCSQANCVHINQLLSFQLGFVRELLRFTNDILYSLAKCARNMKFNRSLCFKRNKTGKVRWATNVLQTHSRQVRIHFATHSLHTEFSCAKLVILQASQTSEPDITFPLLQCSPHCKRFKKDYILQVTLTTSTICRPFRKSRS